MTEPISCVDKFNRENAMVDEVKKAFKDLFLHLYEAKSEKFIPDSIRKSLKRNAIHVEMPSPYFYSYFLTFI